MAKLIKYPSKPDLTENLNNTYCYLDGIFAVNNPDFSKYVTSIYPTELIFNKANQDSSSCPLWI